MIWSGLVCPQLVRWCDTYSQNVKELSQYLRLFKQRRTTPAPWLYNLTPHDQLRRDVISMLMCHNRIDIAAIEQQHGINFNEYFADATTDAARTGCRRFSHHQWRDYCLARIKATLMMRSVAMAFDAYLGEKQRVSFHAPF